MTITNGYNDSFGGYSPSEADEAPDVDAIPGACPPIELWYRIYPEINFNAEFGNPPGSVLT